jgi:HlyD family secretion protein
MTKRPRRLPLVLTAAAALVAVATLSWPRGSAADASGFVVARKGDLVVRLSTSGTLRATDAITYRSPLGARETEITFLAPEGTQVGDGDLLVRLDTTDLQRELERAQQTERQARLDEQVAAAQREDAAAALESIIDGEDALAREEALEKMRLDELDVERLRQEHGALEPLLARGFITREELGKSEIELRKAESQLARDRRRAAMLTEKTRPRDENRARLLIAQREAQYQNARQHVDDAVALIVSLRAAVDACTIYARRPGLVVYEEFLAATPRRKVHVGDRVTASQGIVTIPDVGRMIVESSLRESDVHRVRAGQRVAVLVDAFPDARLTGRVRSLGTLARASADRAFDDKRFDLTVAIDASGFDLRPEMTVRLQIVVDERKEVVLLPVNAIVRVGESTVVHVLRERGGETRAVKLGAADELEVEIIEGVNAGDRVVFSDTSEAPARAVMMSNR